jgi:hypothetical protein
VQSLGKHPNSAPPVPHKPFLGVEMSGGAEAARLQGRRRRLGRFVPIAYRAETDRTAVDNPLDAWAFIDEAGRQQHGPGRTVPA